VPNFSGFAGTLPAGSIVWKQALTRQPGKRGPSFAIQATGDKAAGKIPDFFAYFIYSILFKKWL
jgi:hypothetical protein